MEAVLNRKHLIKICGLKESDQAIAAADAGADLLGFMFATSRRQVTPEIAATMIREVRDRFGLSVGMVGIFVAPSEEDLARTIDVASLDFVQLHGQTDIPDRIRNQVTLYPALAPPPGTSAGDASAAIQTAMDITTAPWCLFDAYHPEQHGGTGKRADWNLAKTLSKDLRLMLAGGLTPQNVRDAIRTVQPLGVDVSSGVERDGSKDIGLIRQFVVAARDGFAAIE